MIPIQTQIKEKRERIKGNESKSFSLSDISSLLRQIRVLASPEL